MFSLLQSSPTTRAAAPFWVLPYWVIISWFELSSFRNFFANN